MARAPLVTIGLTCHDARDTIARAIESARAQDWPRVEILVVDDYSRDGSRAVLEALAEKDPSLRLIFNKENLGVAAARNRLIANANGEFIAFFDDDDISDPRRVTQQWRRLSDYEEEHSTNMVLCYCDRLVRSIDGSVLEANGAGIGRSSPEPHGPMVADQLLLLKEYGTYVWGQCGSGTLFARTSTLRKLGGFDPAFRRGEEWDLAVRAAMEGAHFVSAPEPLITQFVTFGVEKSGRAGLESSLALVRKHRRLLEVRGLYLAALCQAYARFHYAKGHRTAHVVASIAAGVAAPRTLLPGIVGKSRIGRAWRALLRTPNCAGPLPGSS